MIFYVSQFSDIYTLIFTVISNMQYILAIIAIGISIGGMALGLMISNKPLRGSCGGSGGCDTCKGDSNHCENAVKIPVNYL